MHRLRGFRIRHKLVKLVRWKRNNSDSNYIRLHLDRPNYTSKAMSKLCGFARSLTKSAKDICYGKSRSSYIRLGDHKKEVEKNVVPKGHLAVYVGEKEDDARRVLVPVIYFNHPLFGDLLREAEKVYGFNHDGGIHVPCRISEFHNVQTKIKVNTAATGRSDRFRARRSWRLTL
ncbi:SAUR-like auxin-responsive protein family [Artemisia annua]|uniref:SAUR-like auxin-responsive protein family n=1 Tax=Artemisia annua TaxID=35608 RepID=A0A2U1PGS9_ARTAN|nr:SAUR-like auxin-responsive protein family [Artemisia annua]